MELQSFDGLSLVSPHLRRAAELYLPQVVGPAVAAAAVS